LVAHLIELIFADLAAEAERMLALVTDVLLRNWSVLFLFSNGPSVLSPMPL